MGLTEYGLTVEVAGSSLPVTLASEICDIAEWMNGRGLLGLDTETTGLDIYSPSFRVRLLQLADHDEILVVPVELFDDTDRARLGQLIAEHARAWGLAIHNADFDLCAMDAVGIMSLDAISPHDVRDTRSIAYLIDSRPSGVGNALGHGLKPLSDAWIDSEVSDRGQRILAETMANNGWSQSEGWAKIDLFDPDYLRYSALDAWLVRRLLDVLDPHLDELDLRRLEAFDNEVSDACRKMRRHGLEVDALYIESELIPYLEKREAQGRRDALAYGVNNIHSVQQCATALQAMGWTPVELTPSGAPKLDKAVLAELMSQGNDLARAIVQGKTAAKFLSTYAIPLLEERDANGFVHAEIRPTGAITGRMSISKPPLQQLPSTGEDAWRVRRAIIAGEGYVFGGCDYSQVELRLFGALAGEPSLLDAVIAGEDVYSSIASALYGESFTPSDRKTAKMISLARIYGSGINTIARQSGLDVREATDIVARYDRRFPRLKSFSRRVQDRASLSRHIVTPSGRRIQEELDGVYRSVNHLVQSTASDLMKQSLIDLIHEGGLTAGGDICLTVHDEIIFRSEPERFADRALTVESFMTTTFQGMPITSSAELLGPSWGHAYMTP